MKYQFASSEPADHGRRSREDAADEGDDHRQDQVEQQHTGQSERVAGVGEQQRQQRQPDRGDRPSPGLPAWRQRGEDRLHRREAPLPGLGFVGSGLRSLVGALGDHVDVDRAGQAHDAVDDRAVDELVPPRAVASRRARSGWRSRRGPPPRGRRRCRCPSRGDTRRRAPRAADAARRRRRRRRRPDPTPGRSCR